MLIAFKMDSNSCCLMCIIMVIILIAGLFIFIIHNCFYTENFTAPGLTLTVPPSWFPQNAAKKYNPNDWKVRMYLDRYPFKTEDGSYLTDKLSNELASTDRLWLQ
jgi:hypothetical protein